MLGRSGGEHLTIVAAAAYAALVAAWPAAPLAFLVDDAWYYLVTARNIASGLGVTFDRIEPFNGFHPLWMAVLVPVATAAPHPDTLARTVLVLQVALGGTGLWLWSRALGLKQRGLVAGALLLLNPWAAKILVCGQESSLALVVTAASVLVAPRGPAWLGTLAGLATLSRLDLAPVLLALILWHAWAQPRAALAYLTRALASGALVCLPWATWTLWVHGTLVPVSAAVKAQAASLAPVSSLLAGALAALATSAVLIALLRPKAPAAWAATALACTEAFRLVAFHDAIGLPIWYLFAFLPAALAVACRLGERPWVGRSIAVAWVALAAGSWFVRVDPSSYAEATAAREMGHWLKTNTPPDARAAGWDIGRVAAYSNRSFRNLEGLAASWKFKREVLDPGRLGEFLRGGQVDWVAQYFPTGREAQRAAMMGLDPSEWRVAWSRETTMRSVTSRDRPWPMTFLVLRRHGTGTTLREFEAHR